MSTPEPEADRAYFPHAGLRQSAEYMTAMNFIGGKWVDPRADDFHPVLNPSEGRQIARTPLSRAQDAADAVRAAERSFPAWAATTIKERAQVFFRYRGLLEKNLANLAALVQEENGKTRSEAAAEVEKAIEVTEFACSLPQLAAGEVLEVSPGVECRLDRRPVGVVASVAPFNFPIMVPHWTIPNALVLGNTMVFKPSQFVPLSALRIAELLKDAGLPDGVFNLVHGGQEVVEAVCEHPGIQALTFVGSTRVARAVYARAAASLKRALCLGGAKNHLIVLPDAHVEMAATNIAASFTGCAGQRCMAASVLIAVADVEAVIARLCEEAAKVIPGKNLGAIISRESKERIEEFITEAARSGADVLLDGRGARVEGKENGFYVGPTILDRVHPGMRIARDEVFGPVLSVIRVGSFEDAIAIENRNPYGNAAAVFTQSGAVARSFTERANAGMVGVNIGLPVPREPFSFGGWNDSRYGAGDITGKSSIEFFTRAKKTTTKWNPDARRNWMS